MACTRCKELEAEIAALKVTIADLEESVEQASNSLYETEQRSERKLKEADRKAREVRDAADMAEYDRQGALRELERARDRGDEFGAERAFERLKRLS